MLDLPPTADPPNYQTCGGTHYLPKLNTTHPEVRQHLLSVAVHWIEEADIDGWRLDVPWKVPLDFWRAFRARVKQHRPGAYLVGEAWWSWGQMRDVFDGLMNYRLRARIFDFCLFDSQDAEDFAIELQLLLDESAGGDLMLNLLGSHDTARLLTLAGGDERRVALALTALFTLPGTPMIYYGDEIGMEGGDDPDCRRGMLWDEAQWRSSTLQLCQRLATLRRKSEALRRGSFELLIAFNRVLVFRRVLDDEQVIVILNPGAARRDLVIPLPCAGGSFRDMLTDTAIDAVEETLVLPQLEERTALVLTRE